MSPDQCCCVCYVTTAAQPRHCSLCDASSHNARNHGIYNVEKSFRAGVYKNPGGLEFPLAPAPNGGDANACTAAATLALKVGEACGTAAAECSFAGAWGGGPSPPGRKFYVMSYFFDRHAPAYP